MEMACQAVHRWSFIGLVAAFLDLAIAYFLLCASAMAYMVSKFLGFFGLYLPCPSCYGIFGADPNGYLCFQKILIEYPTEKISNVPLSVLSKFPFNDSVWGKNESSNLNLRLMEDRKRDAVELEGDKCSCSSLVSDARKSAVRINGELKNARKENGVGNCLFGFRDGRFDLKGKGMMHQRPRSGIRRRRKGGFDYGNYSSVSSYDPPFGETRQGEASHSPPSINKGGNELVEDDIQLHSFGRNRLHFNNSEEAPTTVRLGYRSSNMFELNEFTDEQEHIRELKPIVGSGLDVGSEDKNMIRLLEQALEEEHAARAALYLELEKERCAAASAADEAMTMIQRLQEEKASIEMETRQYQRMTEEKSAYYAEEMNILKEIIVRREREKHFLEKEAEAYRQMSFIGKEPSSGDDVDMLNSQQPDFDNSFDPNEDPVHLLLQLSASIDNKVMIETKRADEIVHIDKGILAPLEELPVQRLDESSAFQKQGHPAGHLLRFSVCSNDDNSNLQDKVISMDNNSYAPVRNLQRLESFPELCKPGTIQGKLAETATILMGKGREYCDNMNLVAEMDLHILNGNRRLKRHENDSYMGTQSSRHVFDKKKEPRLHDVHVVVDSSNLCNLVNAGDLECMSVNSISEIHRKNNVPLGASAFQRVNASNDYQSTSRSDVEVDIRRSSSDITSSLLPMCPKGKSLLSDLRRNSLSAVHNEWLKIDYEVGWLQERLRVVQKGREKLNLCVENQRRGRMQLKILEDIAIQLQEIRQLIELGKVVRQASLPPPSSKVISKKRRCRSVSSTLQTSS